MTREDRVQYIMSLMRKPPALGGFTRGVTNKALAQQWGLALNSVEDISAEASRRVKSEVTDAQSAKETIALTMAHIMAEGMEMEGEERIAGRKLAIDAAKTLGLATGANAAQKIEVTAVQKLTDEELVSKLEEGLREWKQLKGSSG